MSSDVRKLKEDLVTTSNLFHARVAMSVSVDQEVLIIAALTFMFRNPPVMWFTRPEDDGKKSPGGKNSLPAGSKTKLAKNFFFGDSSGCDAVIVYSLTPVKTSVRATL